MFLAGNMSRRQVDLESHCTSFQIPGTLLATKRLHRAEVFAITGFVLHCHFMVAFHVCGAFFDFFD